MKLNLVYEWKEVCCKKMEEAFLAGDVEIPPMGDFIMDMSTSKMLDCCPFCGETITKEDKYSGGIPSEPLVDEEGNCIVCGHNFVPFMYCPIDHRPYELEGKS